MLLRVTNLHVAYGARTVLRDVSFGVREAECVAIVGPSGSGKTTLLSACGLLLAIDAGEVAIEGRAVAHPTGLRPGTIAWVFQQGNVLPRRSVLDNVTLGPLAGGAPLHKAETLARNALTAVELETRLESQARELSGGELQRVSIARALASRPSLILADEPTGSLDDASSHHIGSLLRAAASHGTGVVVATHDLRLAKSCDRVLEIRDGLLSRQT